MLVRRPPVASIVTYVREQWFAYVEEFTGQGPPLSERTEPQLTEALAAYLQRQQEAGHQPFHGEFYGELTRFDLAPDGTRVRIGRTDIEWRLYGFPNFIVEFKVVDAKRKAAKYVTDGMVRFVDGRYGPRASEGAMWAFIGHGSPENASHVKAHVLAASASLRCIPVNGNLLTSPSAIAPTHGEFDSLHERQPEHGPIALVHLFVDLPN